MRNHQLREVPLFSDISDSVLDELAAASRTRTYPAGQVLWSEGDPGDSLLILESGQVRISRINSSGQEAVLAVLEPPAFLGELALIDGAPRDATVIAQRAVTVRLVPRSTFLQVMNAEPSVTLSLVHVLVTMVREANARHANMIGLDVPGRLAVWLLTRVQRVNESQVVQLGGRSQAELAAELSTTRSTLNRALRDFDDLGYISSTADQILIFDKNALETFTH